MWGRGSACYRPPKPKRPKLAQAVCLSGISEQEVDLHAAEVATPCRTARVEADTAVLAAVALAAVNVAGAA